MKCIALNPNISEWLVSFINKKKNKTTPSHEKNVLKILSRIFNRSEQQCLFMYNLVDKDYDKYIELEIQIKNQHISYVPGTKQEVEKIINNSTKGWYNKKFDKICQEIGKKK